MKRILVYSPDNDPTSWYRSARPWQLLEKRLNQGAPDEFKIIPGSTLVEHKKNPLNDYKIEYVSSTSQKPLPADWDHAGFYDLVFLQRPFHPTILQACANYKRMGCKIWVDEDDLQTNVPWDMDSAYLYMTDEVQRAIRGCLQMADVVTASTAYLAKELQKLTKAEVIQVPNAFDLESFPRPEPKPKQKVILWRGAMPSHRANLMAYRKDIYEVMKANPDWKIMFMGAQPWWYEAFVEEFPERALPNMVFVWPTRTLFDYYATIAEINPAIWICPMVDNPFNRARSNNAWADASWVGARCVAPNWDEWKKPGVCIYDPQNASFKEALELSMLNSNQKMGESRIGDGWPEVLRNLLLPKVNEKRYEIVKRLIG